MQRVIETKTVQQLKLKSLTPDDEEHQWLAARGAQAALLVPLLLHGDAIGMVTLIDINDRVFASEEISLAQGIANVVSNAMENASLYQSLQGRAKALESAYGELQEADRAKDQFMQNVSHELRTPLMHLQGYAELLADNTFGPITPEQEDALKTIVEKGQQIADIVEDMVAVQAIQQGQIFDMQPVDLDSLLHEAIQKNQEQDRRQQPQDHPGFAGDPAAGDGGCQSDPRCLRQAAR